MLGFTHTSPLWGIFGLIVAFLIYRWVAAQPNGTERMQKIEGYIRAGALAFLKRQYVTLLVFVAIVFVLLAVGINVQTALCFLTGAFSSMFAGFFGMMASTKGNSRTACGRKPARHGPVVEKPPDRPRRSAACDFVLSLAGMAKTPELVAALKEFALGQRGSDEQRLKASR